MKNKHEDKRQALLKAALTLFTQHGFDGTPTSKIAKEAGVATGTLFHYFKTKEELINQLYLEIKQELTRDLFAGVSDEQTLRGKVYKIWFNCIAWSLKYPEKLRFFLQFSSSPYISNLTREEATQHLSFIRDLIEEGKRQDMIKEMPTDLLVDINTGLAQVMAMHFLNNPEKFHDEDYREMAFNAYWDCTKR